MMRRLIVTCVCWAGVLTACTGSAVAAATRYASPTGADTASCGASDPCSLNTAIGGATGGDTVVVGSGTYGSGAQPLAAVTAPGPLTIEGVTGSGRPVIYTQGITIDGGSISDLQIEGTYTGLDAAVPSTIERVYVHVSQVGAAACTLSSPGSGYVVQDSVCNASATFSRGLAIFALSTSDATMTATIANDDLSGGSEGMVVDADAHPGTLSVQITVLDSAVKGIDSDILAIDNSASPGTASVAVTASHSDYNTTSTSTAHDPAAPTITDPHTNGNVTRAPDYVDIQAGDFHERSGSPTIDAGSESADSGTIDLDGTPRTLGAHTDIGAYEYQDLYVQTPARGGSDTNNTTCTQANPCATIEHAVTVQAPAATIHVGAGTFTTNLSVSGHDLTTIAGDPARTTLTNPASGGTAVTLFNGELDLEHLTIAGDGAYGVFSWSTLSVSDATVIGNGASGVVAYAGTATISDSTISLNASDGIDAHVPTLVTRTTIARNHGIGLTPSQPGLTVSGSILAGNGDGACHGTITDGGYNLADDSTCSFSATGSGNAVSTLRLGPLADNGGSAETIAPNSLSAAIDAIPTSDAALCTGRDERGVPRPDGNRCDIGAVQAAPTASRLTASAGTITVGDAVTLTATVTGDGSAPQPPAGRLTFNASGSQISGCTGITAVAGAAQCTFTPPAVGTEHASVTFVGTNGSHGSTASLSLTVNPPVTTTTTSAAQTTTTQPPTSTPTPSPPAVAGAHVTRPDNRFRVTHIRTHPDGAITFWVMIPGRGRVDVLETAWNDNVAARAHARLQPAPRRFADARTHATARHAGTLKLTVRLNRHGRLLLHHPRYRVVLRLWITYTPTGGLSRTLGFRGLHLPGKR